MALLNRSESTEVKGLLSPARQIEEFAVCMRIVRMHTTVLINDLAMVDGSMKGIRLNHIRFRFWEPLKRVSMPIRSHLEGTRSHLPHSVSPRTTSKEATSTDLHFTLTFWNRLPLTSNRLFGAELSTVQHSDSIHIKSPESTAAQEPLFSHPLLKPRLRIARNQYNKRVCHWYQ